MLKHPVSPKGVLQVFWFVQNNDLDVFCIGIRLADVLIKTISNLFLFKYYENDSSGKKTDPGSLLKSLNLYFFSS